jgi:hypothetical protein
MEGAMQDSRRYRDSAAECLLAAQEACQPYYRKLAVSWLSLARQDEATDNLFASWEHQQAHQGTGYRPALRREGRSA